MVQLVPGMNNPTHEEIDAYVSKMVNENNHHTLNDVVREIQSKKDVNTLIHPAEEYYIDTIFKCVNIAIFNIIGAEYMNDI
jgi:hypothetical protein